MEKILNYINGEWIEPQASESVEVINPAFGTVIVRTQLYGADGILSLQRLEGIFLWR